ncbi:Spherulation-specific family 4 [Daedaleopsis nitida]|nr:Spherulation-specific family 4 [Daedaleopsis nitida]
MFLPVPRMIAVGAATLSSGLLVPLYINPIGGPSCAGWAPLLNTVTAHPSVPFYTIINPASGPGNANTQPGREYQQCIPQLLSKPNVVVLGYVATWEGQAANQSGVIRDVNTYAAWASAYRPSGIFFDQVSATVATYATYQNFTNRARSSFRYVTLNPGSAPTDDRFYSIADLLLTAENYYTAFSPKQLSLGSSTPASKQAVMLHDAPSTVPTSLINTLIKTDHIKALYVTDDKEANGGNPYDALPSNLEKFVAALQSAAAA